MKSLLDVCAPAKLNLFLHITGRRADGYHLLESVFALIDWCDTLHFECRSDGQLSREDLSEPLPAQDLILDAARALQQASGTRLGTHIAVNKSIPSQAGMGGGSSDAASTLLALNRLWGLGLSLRQLMSIGLTLGADVPFFLGGTHAWVSGIGELLQPVVLPPAHFVVVKPDEGVATGQIFSHPDLKRQTPPAIMADFAADVYGYGHNDLQAVAQQLCPGIGLALNGLSALGLSGRMTGSGSAVFATVPTNFQVPRAVGTESWKVCRSLPDHPLRGWAV